MKNILESQPFTGQTRMDAKKAVFPRKNLVKKILVLFPDSVKVTATMKRLHTLIVLLALTVGALVTGCNKESDTSTPAATNAPTTPPSTNK